MQRLLTPVALGTTPLRVSLGLPTWLAYLTVAAEALGGIALVLGVQARWVALALTPFVLGALFTVHAGNGWVFSAPNGGWEYPAHLAVPCIAPALLGDGAFALVPSRSLTASPGHGGEPASARI